MLAEYRNDFVNVANVMHAHLADLAFLDEQEELEPMRPSASPTYVFAVGENLQ